MVAGISKNAEVGMVAGEALLGGAAGLWLCGPGSPATLSSVALQPAAAIAMRAASAPSRTRRGAVG
jgi:hypothetical protein